MIVQFFVDPVGQVWLLLDDGRILICEMEHTAEGPKVGNIKEFIIDKSKFYGTR